MALLSESLETNSNEFKLTKDFENDNAETDKLRCALSSIAQEVQRYHMESQKVKKTSIKCHETGDADIFGKLLVLRKSLKKKGSNILKLKTNIKAACAIAKSFMSAQEIETTTLNTYLQNARNKVETLSAENRFRDSQLQKLSNEMNTLQERINIIEQVIERGFIELENIRKEPHEDLPVTMQLKKILVCCGKYYADYSFERTRRLKLEQKNRFLINKINILESNLHIVNGDLKNHHQRSRSKMKDRVKVTDISDSEEEKGEEALVRNSFSRLLDLSTHFTFVKKLLSDQNCMLKDLKHLTSELHMDPD